MRSVVVQGHRQVSVEQVPDPVLPGPDGAIVAVETAAICGSDLHFYDGDLPFYPVAVGHEVVGRVVEVGTQVSRFHVGERVLVASVAGCGACAGCQTRNPIACHSGAKVFGSGELGGGQSDLLAVPAADFQLLRVPEGIDDEAALLLTDNLGTGWAGAQRADIPPGGTVVVLGLGAVGLCAVRSALVLGAGRVLAVDPVAGRRARAASFGAEPLAPPESVSIGEAVLAATGGLGADAVIDAVAVDGSLDDAFAAVRATGTISVIGVHDLAPYPMPALMGVFRSITLRMTTAPVHRTWSDLVPLIRHGRLSTTGLFTDVYDLDEAPAAYERIAARTADCVKVRFSVG